MDDIWKNFRNMNYAWLKIVIDWSIYIEQFDSILKQFEDVAGPINNLSIQSFQDGQRHSIHAQFNKKDHNLVD